MIRIDVSELQLVQGQATSLLVYVTNLYSGPCSNIIITFKKPVALQVLEGLVQVKIPVLAAGESHVLSWTVLPLEAGSFELSTSNFSYRDPRSSSCRPQPPVVPLSVHAAEPKRTFPAPVLLLAVRAKSYVVGQWQRLPLHVTNRGPGAVHIKSSSAIGPNGSWHSSFARHPTIQEGDTCLLELNIHPTDVGPAVPVTVVLSHSDTEGRLHEASVSCDVSVQSLPEKTSMPVSDSKPQESEVVLFCAADPGEPVNRLSLDEECRDIKERLAVGREGQRFRLEVCLATSHKQFVQEMLTSAPSYVVFSGHGTARGELCFRHHIHDIPHPVSAEAMADLFEIFANQVQCVILNACYSEPQAKAIVRHIPYVIGMNDAIADSNARHFTYGFFQSIGAGRSVADSFRIGKNAILAHQEPGLAQHNIPCILAKP